MLIRHLVGGDAPVQRGPQGPQDDAGEDSQASLELLAEMLAGGLAHIGEQLKNMIPRFTAMERKLFASTLNPGHSNAGVITTRSKVKWIAAGILSAAGAVGATLYGVYKIVSYVAEQVIERLASAYDNSLQNSLAVLSRQQDKREITYSGSETGLIVVSTPSELQEKSPVEQGRIDRLVRQEEGRANKLN